MIKVELSRDQAERLIDAGLRSGQMQDNDMYDAVIALAYACGMFKCKGADYWDRAAEWNERQVAAMVEEEFS